MRVGLVALFPTIAACATLLGTDFDGTLRGADAGVDGAIDGGDEGSVAADGAAPPVTQVACGDGFTCAIANGQVSCFGTDLHGELGDGQLGSGGARPARVNLPGPASAIAAYAQHACALVAGDVFCWGANDQGQLGDGHLAPASPNPVQVQALGGPAQSIAAGGAHTCAVVAGAVLCWGDGSDGQLGDGLATRSAAPVSAIATGATAVSAGERHTCAVVDGALKCWGLNHGQLGDGTQTTRPAPVDVKNGARAGAISAARTTTCAVLRDSVACWGDSGDANVDFAAAVPVLEPAVVPSVPSPASLVAAHDGGCAVASGALYCWGPLAGDGRPSAVLPIALTGPLAHDVTSTCVGAGHRCAIAAGRIFCWGKNDAGQVGAPPSPEEAVPALVSM